MKVPRHPIRWSEKIASLVIQTPRVRACYLAPGHDVNAFPPSAWLLARQACSSPRPCTPPNMVLATMGSATALLCPAIRRRPYFSDSFYLYSGSASKNLSFPFGRLTAIGIRIKASDLWEVPYLFEYHVHRAELCLQQNEFLGSYVCLRERRGDRESNRCRKRSACLNRRNAFWCCHGNL